MASHSDRFPCASYVSPGRWLMADPNSESRSMTVDLAPGHYTDPSYIAEKYRDAHGRCSAWTAAVLAELLNMVAGVDDDLLARMRAACPDVFAPLDAP